ncbi:MAG: hypothetical protein R3E42_05865 [Burkholderiaceae bacterium]
MHRITEGPLGARLLKGLERQGMVGLGFWTTASNT